MCVIPYDASTACCASAVIQVVICCRARCGFQKPRFQPARRPSHETRTDASFEPRDSSIRHRLPKRDRRDKSRTRPVCDQGVVATRMVRAAALCAIVLAQATAFVAPPAATPALTPRQGLLEPYGSALRRRKRSNDERTTPAVAGIARSASVLPGGAISTNLHISRHRTWHAVLAAAHTLKLVVTQAASTLSRRSARPSRSSRRRSY